MDNYGARFRALLVPPTTGWYRLSLASDDAGELFWSPSTNTAEKIAVAVVSNYTNVRRFDKERGQTSSNLYMMAGQMYYVEALVKEGTGDDHLCVRWGRPDGVTNTPVPGQYLHRWVCFLQKSLVSCPRILRSWRAKVTPCNCKCAGH